MGHSRTVGVKHRRFERLGEFDQRRDRFARVARLIGEDNGAFGFNQEISRPLENAWVRSDPGRGAGTS